MADEKKRIIDQPIDTELSAGDYVIVDSEETGVGSRRFDLGSELRDIKEDLQTLTGVDIHVEGTALVINTEITDGNEVSY